MRGRMNDVKSYVPPFQLGEPMEGGAVGEVVESNGRRLRAGRPRPAHGRLARRGGASPRATANKLPDLGAQPRAVPRHSRRDRRDRLFRAARRRLGQGRRHRVRLGRRRRGRLGGRPDRQGQGHDRDRLGRRRRRNATSSARSAPTRSIDYKAGPILKGLAAAAPDGHRRLFRQCRRRPSRRRVRARPQQRALRHLRDDRGLQQRPSRRASASSCGSSPRASGCRASSSSIICRGWANSTATWAAGSRAAQVKSRETVVDGLESDARRLPRPVQRRQHRQDAGPALERLAGGRVAGLAARAEAPPSAAPRCRG